MEDGSCKGFLTHDDGYIYIYIYIYIYSSSILDEGVRE